MTAPTISPCPVPWCDEIGAHAWDVDEVDGSLYGRTHRHEAATIEQGEPLGSGDTVPVTVAVETWETTAGNSAPYLEISNGQAVGAELHTAEQVGAFVEGVLTATAVAFPGFVEQSSADLPDLIRGAVFAPHEAVTTWEEIADAIRTRYYVTSRPAAGEVTR